MKQECIPVGCVPPTAVAVGRGVCLSACWDTHTHTLGVDLAPPFGCGPGDPLGVGLETPWVWAQRLPGQTPPLPPGCGPGNLQGMLGYHPPSVDRQTHVKT